MTVTPSADVHRLVRSVVTAGDRPSQRSAVVAEAGRRAVAELLVAELGVRGVPWDGPRAVEIDHVIDGERFTVRHGPVDGAADRLEVRATLDELWTALYGGGAMSPAVCAVRGAKHVATRFRGGLLRRPGLIELAERFDCDKWGLHCYAPHYEAQFTPLRDRRLTVLEIGVGGGDEPGSGGASLRMWKHFFPRALLYGIDIIDKSAVDEPRIRTFTGDQSDPAFLDSVLAETGPPDVIIDDGSHVNAHVIASFTHLFPHLRHGGRYVIEDLHTAYWPRFGGSSDDLTRADTSVGLLKTLVDGLHHEELLGDGRSARYTDRHVTGLHLFHNLAFIEKGHNTEGTILDVFPGAREAAASHVWAEDLP